MPRSQTSTNINPWQTISSCLSSRCFLFSHERQSVSVTASSRLHKPEHSLALHYCHVLFKSTCNKNFYSGFKIMKFEYNAVWLWESGKGGCLIHLLRWLTAETRIVIIFLAPVTFLVMDTRHGESGLMETLIHVPPISLSSVVNAALVSSIHSNVLSCDFYFFCISRPWLVVRRSMFLCCIFAELGLF